MQKRLLQIVVSTQPANVAYAYCTFQVAMTLHGCTICKKNPSSGTPKIIPMGDPLKKRFGSIIDYGLKNDYRRTVVPKLTKNRTHPRTPVTCKF